MDQNIKDFFQRVQAAKSIAIMGHKNPDGDSLCSVLALAHLIEENFGVSPVCLYDGNIPENLTNVPLRSRIKYFERVDMTQVFDLAIVMDYGNPVHIGGPKILVDNAKFVIEIYREQFDFATARAVADLRLLCEMCLPFVKVGGRFLSMKSVESDSELEQSCTAIEKLGGKLVGCHDYAIPHTNVTHRVVVIDKVAPTPSGYPRRWAKIQKSPL